MVAGRWTGLLIPCALLGLLWSDAEGTKYGISVSASASDPGLTHLTNAPQTQLSLYLWCRCAEEGMGSLEGIVESSYDVVDFIPASGVVNAGTPGHLRIGINECPTGDALLGEWIVSNASGDSSGFFCLAAPDTALPTCRVDDCIRLGNPFGYYADLVGFAAGDSTSCDTGEMCEGSAAVGGGEAGAGHRR